MLSFHHECFGMPRRVIGFNNYLLQNFFAYAAINIWSSSDCRLDLIAADLQSGVKLANTEAGGTWATAKDQILRVVSRHYTGFQ